MVLFTFLIFGFVILPVSAQNGAFIYRDYITDTAAAYDGNSVLLFFTTLPDFCNSVDDDWLARLKVVDNQNKTHWQLTGFYHAMVFDPVPDLQAFRDAGGPCAHLEDVVAEGIIRGTWVDNDWDWENDHQSWGWNYSGTIYDLTGECDTGMVEVNYHFRGVWSAKKGQKVNVKGPRYQCYME
jgi:hypothetical protein